MGWRWGFSFPERSQFRSVDGLTPRYAAASLTVR